MKAAPLEDLISHMSRLPGIGERTATRLAFHLLRAKPQYRESFAQALRNLDSMLLCSLCRNVTEQSPCKYCSSPIRSGEVLCVLEKASDIFAVERLGRFKGHYFILHGLLSPLEGVSPEDLGLERLLKRLQDLQPTEVIFALNPSVEGDTTAAYLTKVLRPKTSAKLSRLATGLPTGSELEYADQITLGKAFEGRTELR